jgi:hypothetical protein
MAEKSPSAIEYTKYWESERKMLLESTGNALPKYLLTKGWKVNEIIKTPYEIEGGQKFKNTIRSVSASEINDPKTNWKGRSLKGVKEINGQAQFISMGMLHNPFIVWVDYNKNPKLEITQPPRQYFFFAMQAEQKFMEERLHRLPKHLQDFVKPFTTAKLNVDTLAADYHELEPMRQVAIKHFAPELNRMMDFNLNIKLRYLAKNPALGVSEKPGGSMMSLFNPSDETVKLRALEMAKITPDKSMLQWLNRREGIEVLVAYREMASKIGDQPKIKAFYESRQEMQKIAAKKEAEIVNGIDTLFKATTTIHDMAQEHGFKFQRTTSEREFYTHEGSPKGKIIISFPKLNPFIYRNHSNERAGGSVKSFPQEFKDLKPVPVEVKPTIQQTSALDDMSSIAARYNLALSEEDMKQSPAEKTIHNPQLEMELSSFRKSTPQ